MQDGTVADIRIGGQGCSISQSSASMMSAAVKGKTLDEVQALTRAFKGMMSIHEQSLDGDGAEPAEAVDPDVKLGDLEALRGVVKFPCGSSAPRCRGTPCSRRSTSPLPRDRHADDPPHRTRLRTAARREMLSAFLDYHRATLADEGRRASRQAQLGQTIASSTLTLGGLLKHMALVEDSWFTERFAGQPMPAPFDDVDWDADRDWEFRTAADDTPEWLQQRYVEACDRSRAVVAAATRSTSSPSPASQPVRSFTLRWILCHMIEETARHNGHADLLREAIDGATGE